MATIFLFYFDWKKDKQEEIKQDKIEEINFSKIKEFSQNYWLLTFIIGFGYLAYYDFTNIGNKFLQKRYGFTSTLAGDYLTGMYLSVAIFAPFFGKFVDEKGNRGILLII